MSWILHSLNVAYAHVCVNREEIEYVKCSLDYTNLTNVKPNHLHHYVNTSPPTTRIE